MNTMARSLDTLEVLLVQEPIDLPRVRTALGNIREQYHKMNASQQTLIESNQALLQRIAQLEKHGRK
jgi:hypothetical protein